MKQILLLSILMTSTFAHADQDILVKQVLSLKAAQIEQVMSKTEANIKPFVEGFKVRLDSGSKIVSPQKVGGTILQPVLNVTIKKCVFLFCQTINLDAEFSLKVVNGVCAYNYQLSVDLQRSSQMLTDLYSHINTDICVKKVAGGAEATLQVNLVHATQYQSGIVQKQAFGLISLQGTSIIDSFKAVMKTNGVTDIK